MKKNAFTLVETLISIAIFAMVAAVIYLFFMVGVGNWEIGTARVQLQAQARQAMDAMVGELKNATRSSSYPTRILTIPPVPNNDTVSFYLPDHDAAGNVLITIAGGIQWPTDDADYVQYRYLAGTRQLIREDRSVRDGLAGARVLANNVSSIQFINASIDGLLYLNEVNIALNLEKTTPKGRLLSFSLRSTVRLRN